MHRGRSERASAGRRHPLRGADRHEPLRAGSSARPARSTASAPRMSRGPARAIGARLVAISTNEVFDGAQRSPYTEDDAAASAQRVRASRSSTARCSPRPAHPDTLIVRTSWLYGDGYVNFNEKVLDGRARRAPAVVRDGRGRDAHVDRRPRRARSARCSNADAPPGIYHLSNEGEASRYDWARGDPAARRTWATCPSTAVTTAELRANGYAGPAEAAVLGAGEHASRGARHHAAAVARGARGVLRARGERMPMPEQPSVAIVVVNYNSAAFIDEFCASLTAIAVSDTGGSSSSTRARPTTRCRASNAHFRTRRSSAAARTSASRRASTSASTRCSATHGDDYVLFLNPDTVVTPDFLSAMVDAADARSDRRAEDPVPRRPAADQHARRRLRLAARPVPRHVPRPAGWRRRRRVRRDDLETASFAARSCPLQAFATRAGSTSDSSCTTRRRTGSAALAKPAIAIRYEPSAVIYHRGVRIERRRLDDAVQAVLRDAQPAVPGAAAFETGWSAGWRSPPTSWRDASQPPSSLAWAGNGSCCVRCGWAFGTTISGAWDGRTKSSISDARASTDYNPACE